MNKTMQEINRLRRVVREQKMIITILERLLKDGVFYINYYSSDCDGADSQGHQSFTSYEDFKTWEDRFHDNQEGPQSFELTTKDDLEESVTTYTK